MKHNSCCDHRITEGEGPFVQGKEIRGSIQPTTVDSDVAEMQKPHAGKLVQLQIDRIEFENLFSFKWHPYAVDPYLALYS